MLCSRTVDVLEFAIQLNSMQHAESNVFHSVETLWRQTHAGMVSGTNWVPLSVLYFATGLLCP